MRNQHFAYLGRFELPLQTVLVAAFYSTFHTYKPGVHIAHLVNPLKRTPSNFFGIPPRALQPLLSSLPFMNRPQIRQRASSNRMCSSMYFGRKRINIFVVNTKALMQLLSFIITGVLHTFKTTFKKGLQNIWVVFNCRILYEGTLSTLEPGKKYKHHQKYANTIKYRFIFTYQ